MIDYLLSVIDSFISKATEKVLLAAGVGGNLAVQAATPESAEGVSWLVDGGSILSVIAVLLVIIKSGLEVLIKLTELKTLKQGAKSGKD